MATAAFSRRIDEAAEQAGEPPRPLRRPMRSPQTYPIEALGSVIGPAVEGARSIIEAPIEVCAQSALANAALAVQGHANIALPTDQSKPLCLFLISVAGSGERKSAADTELGWAVDKFERQLTETTVADKAAHKNEVEAWTVARAQIKTDHKGADQNTLVAALNALGTEPLPPLEPILTFPDPTLEGLHKFLAVGQPSMALFSDEGGMFVGGVGMSKENALKTAAGLSKFWDGAPIRRLRAGDGNLTLFGRRVSLHLMLQPDAAMTWLSDPVLRDQGLFSRMLIAAPTSLAGTRFGRQAAPGARAAVTRFGARILNLLETPCPRVEGKPSELAPRDIGMTDDAKEMWWAFRDAVESELHPDGKWVPVRALANKICEHAARLATVLALIDDLQVEEIDGAALASGIKLATWYLGEALRLAEVGYVSDDVRLAEALLHWLTSSWADRSSDGGKLISAADVYRLGPAQIREKAVAQRAIDVLVDHGWLVKIQGGATVNGVPRRDAYRVVEG